MKKITDINFIKEGCCGMMKISKKWRFTVSDCGQTESSKKPGKMQRTKRKEYFWR